MGLDDEKYVRFTTYRRDGTPVSTATWIVPLDGGRYGFWTASTTGKVKRLAHTPRVEIQPSDGRGRAKAGTQPTAATAVLVAEGEDFEAVQRRVRAKYGIQTTITRLLARVAALFKRRPFAYADRAVVITPDEPSES